MFFDLPTCPEGSCGLAEIARSIITILVHQSTVRRDGGVAGAPNIGYLPLPRQPSMVDLFIQSRW